MKRLKKMISSYRQKNSSFNRICLKVNSYFEYMPFSKGVSILCVLYLIFSDFMSLFQLFKSDGFDLKDSLACIIAITVAIMLEGFPIFTGNYLTSLFEKRIDNSQDSIWKKGAMFFGSVVGALITFVTTFGLRIIMMFITLEDVDKDAINVMIEKQGYFAQKIGDILRYLILQSDDPPVALTNLFLAILPILTSVLCFIISISYLSPNHKKKQQDKLQQLQKRSSQAEYSYTEKVNRLRNEKIALWNELNITLSLPFDNISEFHSNCLRRIHVNMEHSCSRSFEREIERFNKEGQSKLQSILIKMSAYSSVPQRITSIAIDDIIRDYDNSKTDAEAWEFNRYHRYANAKLCQALQDLGKEVSSTPLPESVPVPVPSKKITDNPFDEEIEKKTPVPRIIGYTLEEADKILQEEGFKIDRSNIIYIENDAPKDIVIRQEYENESTVPNAEIKVTVSLGPNHSEASLAPAEQYSDQSLLDAARNIVHNQDSK